MHIKFNHNNPQTPVDEKEQAENDLDILKKKSGTESHNFLWQE